MARYTLDLDLNRVEGDLTFQVEIEDGQVADARCVGTTYRGFEQIMIGRSPLDALVITPRICGICSTAQLYAAVCALEQVWGVAPPANAVHIRNATLMAEIIQSDLRQTFLFFTPDFCHARYAELPARDAVIAAFTPFQGWMYLETLRYSRRVTEIIALFAGQWPHSSHMAPGGVTAKATIRRIVDGQSIIAEITRWVEQRILGGDLEAWLALAHGDEFEEWVMERPAAALALLSQAARFAGLSAMGFGSAHMLSYGAFILPEPTHGQTHWMAPGALFGDRYPAVPLEPAEISEHVRHSWFRPYPGGKHPFDGETVPDYQPASDRYSWAKAPRYGGAAMQTGPLADLLVDGDPLITDLYRREGGSAWLRQLARVRRMTKLLLFLRQTLNQLAARSDEPHSVPALRDMERDGQGAGMLTAARGALGHWVSIRNGVFDRYQIITPTSWNASPRDSNGVRGHWEESLIGVPVTDPEDPLEIGHVIRSLDPCLVCAVHFLDSGSRVRFGV
ncbi:MAG: nickel-dependent hydrogenase large subunit [Candidatus Competibacteraceae bacterium]|nr:nickel-dependent hydrogenase large subunit [Candidatus Competibacteraceae bacterium]